MLLRALSKCLLNTDRQAALSERSVPVFDCPLSKEMFLNGKSEAELPPNYLTGQVQRASPLQHPALN